MLSDVCSGYAGSGMTAGQKKRHKPQKNAIKTTTPMIANDCFRNAASTGWRLDAASYSHVPHVLHLGASSHTFSPQSGQKPVSSREKRLISYGLGPSSIIAIQLSEVWTFQTQVKLHQVVAWRENMGQVDRFLHWQFGTKGWN